MSPNDGGEFNMKQSRLDNPSGWIELTRYETVRLLIDVLLEAPPEYKFNKSELERRTGLSREAIRNHLPRLVELGIVEELENGQWSRYKLNDDGKVTQELFELNSAVNSVLSGGPKNTEEGTALTITLSDFVEDVEGGRNDAFPSLKSVDNSSRKGPENDLIDQPPTDAIATNAD